MAWGSPRTIDERNYLLTYLLILAAPSSKQPNHIFQVQLGKTTSSEVFRETFETAEVIYHFVMPNQPCHSKQTDKQTNLAGHNYQILQTNC